MTPGPNEYDVAEEVAAPAVGPAALNSPFVDRLDGPQLGSPTSTYAAPNYTAPGDDPYTPPGYPGPNTTGADLSLVTSGDPNALENLRIVYAQQNLRWTAYHESKLRAREAARIGPYITDIGPVILAANKNENCNYLFWRSHATTIRELGGTPFSPNVYSAFDNQFAIHADFPAITDQAYDYPGAGPDSYSYWKPLRTNLAIVRNLIYSQYFPDGEFNPNDKKDQAARQRIEVMAQELGGIFSRSTIPLVGEALSSLPVSLANIPDLGAQRIYKHLASDPRWGLTPVQDTALSDAQLAAFAEATSDVSGINEPLGDYLAKRAEQNKDMAIANAQPFITPEEMSKEAQRQSIQEAKTILDKFRLQYAIASLDLAGKELPQARVGFGEPQEDIVMADQLTMLSRIYEQNIRHLAALPGGIDPAMQAMHNQTTTTMGKLAFALRDRAEYAVAHTWDDPQARLKAQHLVHTFPKDAQGQPLPAEWRQADPGVRQPLLAYATGLYSSIQAVQGRIRLLQQEKNQDQHYTGIMMDGMAKGADVQPGLEQNYAGVAAVAAMAANAPKPDVAAGQQKIAQQTNYQQNQSANSANRNATAATRITQGTQAQATTSTSASSRTNPQARIPTGLKSSAALESSIRALKNFGMPQGQSPSQTQAQAAQANQQLQTQMRQRSTAKAAAAQSATNPKNIGTFTASATKPAAAKTTAPLPQATAENVLPGSKNKAQWTVPGNGPKGPGL